MQLPLIKSSSRIREYLQMYLIGLSQFYPIRKFEDITEKEVKLCFFLRIFDI
jgi:hypothetical protein